MGGHEASSLGDSVYARVCRYHLSGEPRSSASLPSPLCSPNTLSLAPSWSVTSFLPSSSSLQSSHSVLEGSAQRLSCPLGASWALPAPSHPIFLPRVWSFIAIEAPAGVDGTVLRACNSPGPGIQQEAHLAVGLSVQFSSVQCNSKPFNLIRVSVMREPGGAYEEPQHMESRPRGGWRNAAH